jgi:predicted metal-dependent phosphoesterase TrpH
VLPTTKHHGKADIHIHSAADDGLATPAEIVEYVEQHTDLDLIAITDHDTIHGGLEAAELAARRNYCVQVLPGIEVTSRGGHVLALGVTRPIRMLQSLDDTIAAAHEQGGFVVIPHPLSWLTTSVGRRALERILQNPRSKSGVVGIETLNPTFAGRVMHERVCQLNRERWHLPETGGSDAHSLSLIGSAYTRFEGRTAEDFRRSLACGTTQVGGRFWTLEDHTAIAGRQLWRSMVVAPCQRFPRAFRAFVRGKRPSEPAP